jgi:hypothetical protein
MRCKKRLVLVKEKDIVLNEYGIAIISKKGNLNKTQEFHNDYTLYMDNVIKIFIVMDGHGAYGNRISNIV